MAETISELAMSKKDDNENAPISSEVCIESPKSTSDRKRLQLIRRYKCGFCGTNINDEELFVAHIQEHHNETKKKAGCSNNKNSTIVLETMNKEESIEHQSTSVEHYNTSNNASICKDTSTILNPCLNIVTNSSPEGQGGVDDLIVSGAPAFLCTICNKSFDTPRNLVNHKQEHYPYLCTHCEFRARTIDALEEHRITLHSPPIKLRSPEDHGIPQEIYMPMSLLRNPEGDRIAQQSTPISQSVSPEDQRIAQHSRCILTIPSQSNSQITTPKKPKLSIDNRLGHGKADAARLEAALTKIEHFQNVEKHSRIIKRVFHCSQCKFSSTQDDAFRMHVKGHLPTDRNLEKQLRLPTFECQQCHFVAKTKSTLVRHMSTHSNGDPKPFKCDDCSYSSHRRGSLQRHLDTHRADRPFKCNHCTYTATGKHYLTKHIKSIHPDLNGDINPDLNGDINPDLNGDINPDLNGDVKSGKQKKRFRCSVCDFTDTKKHVIVRHIETAHNC